MNDKVKLLQQAMEENRKADEEAAKENFPDDIQLTEEEKARLNEIKDTTMVYLSDKDSEGQEVTMGSAKEYAKPLDDKQITIRDIDGVKDTLKVINSGDVERSIDDIRNEAKTKALMAFKSLSVGTKSDISDTDYLEINNRAINDLTAWVKANGLEKSMRDREGHLDVDKIIKYLNRQPLTTICSIFNKDFLDVYMTPEEMASKNIKAKERLLTSIAYLMTTGPEMDYLNDYIDHEERLMVVSKRLAKCQIDFAEMLKDPKAMSDMLMESRQYSPKDESFWSRYIQDPKLLHSKFAHNIVIYQKYAEAYTKILDEYPIFADDDQEGFQKYLDNMADTQRRISGTDIPTMNQHNAEARDIIQHEIDECNRKIEVYKSICDLTLMRELWDILEERLKNDKRVTMDYLTKEAVNAVERIRRCKQNVPFPGYKGDERKAEQIFTNFMIAFRNMIATYNYTLDQLEKKGESEFGDMPKNDVTHIGMNGYDGDAVYMVYGIYLVILMGRILKRCTRADATKIDAITLDAYFQIFCNLGSDLYMMTDIWNMMKDFVLYTMDHIYMSDVNAHKAKQAKIEEKRAAAPAKKAFTPGATGGKKKKKKK